MKTTMILLCMTLLSHPALAAPSADEPIKATFSLTPAGSITAYTKHVASAINRQKDGSFAAARIEVPLTTLTTDNSLRDQHMKQKYLEVAKFPKAILSGLIAKGGKFSGKLTLHGQTAPVAGEYKVNGSRVSATFPLKLETYKIKIPNYLGVGVEDEGTVEVNLPIKK